MRKNLRLYYGEIELFAGMVLTFVLAILAVMLFGGCVTRTVTLTQGTNAMTIKSTRPGWPWTVESLDVAKLQMAARTNGIYFGAVGDVSQTSNTNFNAMIATVVEAAVKAAASAAK